jgi:hypothetical protein
MPSSALEGRPREMSGIITLETLQRAADLLGRKLRLELA